MSEYYKRMPSALTHDERDWVRDASAEVAAQFDEAVIVHLGVCAGTSMHCSRAGAPEAVVVGVDLAPEKFDPGPWERDEWDIIEGDSRVVHVWFPHEAVHFLFIDADHEEGSVLAELAGWLPRVPEGGVVAFHDYGNAHLRWCRGVQRAVDAWDWTGWVEVEAVDSIRAFRRDAEAGADAG